MGPLPLPHIMQVQSISIVSHSVSPRCILRKDIKHLIYRHNSFSFHASSRLTSLTVYSATTAAVSTSTRHAPQDRVKFSLASAIAEKPEYVLNSSVYHLLDQRGCTRANHLTSHPPQGLCSAVKSQSLVPLLFIIIAASPTSHLHT